MPPYWHVVTMNRQTCQGPVFGDASMNGTMGQANIIRCKLYRPETRYLALL